jgi:integrase
MKLTKGNIAALKLPAGKNDVTVWDDELPGFGVRLRQGKDGVSKTYRIQYRVGGVQQRSKALDCRRVNVEDARRVARQLFAQAHLGIDVAADKDKARADVVRAKLTLGAVSDRYLAVKAEEMKSGTYSESTYVAAQRYFKTHWAALRDRPLDAIKRIDIAVNLQELTSKRGRSAAAKARNILSTLYSWAMAEGLCDSNPVIATRDPEAGVLPRERVLSDSEIKIIWSALDGYEFGEFTAIVRLLLLTGCRRAEIGGLRWSEVDNESGTLTIPGTRTKNRRTLVLPLPAPALNILRQVPRNHNSNVFGGRDGFTSWAVFTKKLNDRLAAGGMSLPHWTLHDLRRTMRTGLGRLGVRPDICEMVINHAPATIIATYDRYRYQPEIANALLQWSEHVTAIAEGRKRKVVPLRA